MQKVYYIELYQYKMDNLPIDSRRRVRVQGRVCENEGIIKLSDCLLFGTKIGTE